MVSEKTENYSVNKMVCLPSGVIFLPFLQMHPFFHGNSIKKRLLRPIVSELNFVPPIVSELLHISNQSFRN